jgi:hypothetical protein
VQGVNTPGGGGGDSDERELVNAAHPGGDYVSDFAFHKRKLTGLIL